MKMRERKLIKYTQLREKFKTRLALFRYGVCAYIKNRKLIKFFLNEFGAFFPRWKLSAAWWKPQIMQFMPARESERERERGAVNI